MGFRGNEANGGLGRYVGLMADLAELAGGMRFRSPIPVRMAMGRSQVAEHAEEVQQEAPQEEPVRG
jgi:hypothetical protein